MTYHDPTIRAAEITPKELYLNRRQFIKTGIGATVATAAATGLLSPLDAAAAAQAGQALENVAQSAFTVNEPLTTPEDATSYVNFYEFSFDKRIPANAMQDFKPRPWTVTVAGHVKRPGEYALDDILQPHQLEERIYRFRCVEAWSMVIPWVGFPLADLIARFEPTAQAKYIAFTTLMDPAQMPNQQRPSLPWPYREGLRLDEAMHPLTFLAVGMYGEVLPTQNGAPLRLVVPWKYGFKSIKAIVKIEFVETPPLTTWTMINAQEYGFYANVNPDVDHPRWSQARERRIGEAGERDTLMFNGYAAEVADLYAGLNLRQHY